MTTYHVRVERGDWYWLAHVVELDRWTQARTLRDVEPMARDLVATMVGTAPDSAAPDSFGLTTDIALPAVLCDLDQWPPRHDHCLGAWDDKDCR